jgi:hypothetical protein
MSWRDGAGLTRLLKVGMIFYLVSHGVPVTGDLDLRAFATTMVYSVLAQLRLIR